VHSDPLMLDQLAAFGGFSIDYSSTYLVLLHNPLAASRRPKNNAPTHVIMEGTVTKGLLKTSVPE
jgi:hypothetical protein